MNRQIKQEDLAVEFKQDYLNIDRTVAISAEGVIFKVGDTVKHEGVKHEETAVILNFTVNLDSFDVIANTDKGTGRISFLYH